MRSMHAIQARDAVWRRQRAATAARLPPRDAHVKAWRVARLHAVGEEARAALRCAEAARDSIELATRELAAARASDRAEILQLRTLIETSAVDQAELLRLRELTKTPAFDHAELLRHEGGLVRHQAALDMVYTELGELARARDDLQTELYELGSAHVRLCSEHDDTKAVVFNLENSLRVEHDDLKTSLRSAVDRHETASGKTVDELSTRVDRIVRDMGCIWGQKWQNGHEFDNW
jgi:chromosome segregation ATPase